jgi:hypothetical protein
MGTIHSSLDDATPEEFAESFKEQKPLTQSPFLGHS